MIVVMIRKVYVSLFFHFVHNTNFYDKRKCDERIEAKKMKDNIYAPGTNK